MIFMLRRKMFTKNMINKNLENTSIVENMVTLVKKFKQKQGKLKNKLNISKIDDSDKEDLIRILESRSSNSSDNDVLTSTDSNYHYDR